MTEGCRSEGRRYSGQQNGYRYLQDYGMGPKLRWATEKTNIWNWVHATKFLRPSGTNGVKATPSPRPWRVVYLDLRHLGEKKLHERLPFICELAAYVGVDPVKEPIPVRPTAHYTMGGIETDQNCETRIKGLFAVGECSSVGLHGANRLGQLAGGTGGLRSSGR